MKSKEFDPIRKNRNLVIRKVRQALRDFGAEQAILIIGKDEIVTLESGIIKHQYPMRVVEIFNNKVYSNFMNALGREILRLKALQSKKSFLQ